jgi:hypothetical protein
MGESLSCASTGKQHFWELGSVESKVICAGRKWVSLVLFFGK